MILEYWGKSLRETDLRKLLKTKPTGTSPINLYNISPLGFDVSLFQSSIQEISSFVYQKLPPIVFIWREPILHAVVVTGFNQETDQLYINDLSEIHGNKGFDIANFSEAWSFSNQLTAVIKKTNF